MTYSLHERPDGQVEIVFSTLIGIFPERDNAEKVCAFLQMEEPELTPEEPPSFLRAVRDVAEAGQVDLSDVLPAETSRPQPVARRGRKNLPAVIKDKPRAPVSVKTLEPHDLSADQIAKAFARIQNGEKIFAVAADFGLSMGQLRGLWANHKRQLQKFMAQEGQQPCKHCARPFTPSISQPDTCARCTHE